MSNTTTVDRVEVTHGDYTVWVRPKMGFGVRNRVISAAAHMMAGDTNADVDIGAYNNALLLHNILEWHGPGLDGQAVTLDALDALDADVGDAVLARINELNAKAADPKGSTNGSGPGSKAAKA